MSLQDSKNSYGAVDLEQGSQTLDTKDAVAGGTSRPVWSATGSNGKIIKSYCPWVWAEGKHRGKYCKQMKNNVLVSTACPCACASF